LPSPGAAHHDLRHDRPVADAVLDEISRSTKRRYRAIDRFRAGENRSTWLVGDRDERLVLKGVDG
jgi:hypothetical protein